MIVDFHSHLSPPAWLETRPIPPVLVDVDGFFAAKAEAGIDVAVVSNAMLNLPGAPVDNLALDQIKEWNEFARELVASYPGKVAVSVGVNPFGGQEMLDVMSEALSSGDFVGVTVNSSIEGEFLDSPRAAEFWSLADSLNAIVFVHPPGMPAGGAGLTDQRVLEFAARAADTAISVAALLFAGVLDRCPNVRLIAAAGGGGLGALMGRLEVAYRSGRGGDGGPARPPSSYLGQIYVDTCSYAADTIRWNVELLGADHVLFGTDSPPLPLPAVAALGSVRGLPLSNDEHAAILGANAAGLLGLVSERPDCERAGST